MYGVPKGISVEVDSSFDQSKPLPKPVQASSKAYGFTDVDDDIYTYGSYIYRRMKYQWVDIYMNPNLSNHSCYDLLHPVFRSSSAYVLHVAFQNDSMKLRRYFQYIMGSIHGPNSIQWDISGVEVGQHFYWKIGGFQVHGQVLITSWVVIAILLGSTTILNPQTIQGVNFLNMFLNSLRSLLPWKIIQLPHGELSTPNDINTTFALALLTSVAYFYRGSYKKGLGYFGKYIQPTPILLPINILEDFTKPLSIIPLVVPILSCSLDYLQVVFKLLFLQL
ncbi:hypothetical protein H5410_017888 [Solanum commersonii]|uniref:Uncharacterized protein n=1 Tax=Solanum commersonii TaxID=4109 RepID=A0A9J6A0R4_SOLCO|nr:hypothetical protein H5410_017888 [Solanum commersonii]